MIRLANSEWRLNSWVSATARSDCTKSTGSLSRFPWKRCHLKTLLTSRKRDDNRAAVLLRRQGLHRWWKMRMMSLWEGCRGRKVWPVVPRRRPGLGRHLLLPPFLPLCNSDRVNLNSIGSNSSCPPGATWTTAHVTPQTLNEIESMNPFCPTWNLQLCDR